MAVYTLTTTGDQETALQDDLAALNAERSKQGQRPLTAEEFLQLEFNTRFDRILSERRQQFVFDLQRQLTDAPLGKLLAVREELRKK